MKFKHVRDRERGYQRRIEELEEALRHIRLACEAIPDFQHTEEMRDCIWIVHKKCKDALDRADNA